jgi:rod shape determining protein RodA
MTRRVNILANIDWITIVLYLVLVVFGWMNIFAVNYNEQFKTIFDTSQKYGNQLLWIAISIIAIFVIFIIDYKFYPFFAYVIYGITVVLLIAVLVFGKVIHGSKSWITLLGFNFQPAEFAKIATSLAIAKYLSTFNVTIRSFKSIVILIAFITVPAVLIFLQPDWGTTIVFCCFFFVLFREGLPGWVLVLGALIIGLFIGSLLFSKLVTVIGLMSLALITHYAINKKLKHAIIAIVLFVFIYFIIKAANLYGKYNLSEYGIILITLIISSVICIILSMRYKIHNVAVILLFLFSFIAFTYSVDYVFHNVLKPHQQKRVNILLGKESDPRGYGYNVNQSKIAIGSGGFKGMGYLKGTQTKLDFVPEQSTDFIFCAVGEEWGFIGTTVVIILFTLLLLRIIFLAERQRSLFTRIYGYGVASIIFIHCAINIGMTIGLSPVIGIPLPFFSYGGSSLLSFSILLFILVRLDASRMAYLK